MASKVLPFLLAVILVVSTRVSSTDDQHEMAAAAAPMPHSVAPAASPMSPKLSGSECVSLCEKRCSMTKRKRRCVRACCSCCHKCQCVPPGPLADKRACGTCYAETTSRQGRPKCH